MIGGIYEGDFVCGHYADGGVAESVDIMHSLTVMSKASTHNLIFKLVVRIYYSRRGYREGCD